MISFLDPLRCLTADNVLWVTLFRLGVATFCGGCIGLERGKKRRPAGFRTHMLVCIGAALAMLISQYLTMMTTTYWSSIVENAGSTDVARLGAQVINGIGFLGAGTIIVTGQQEVKGLTTAAGLWASACMGLCIGAGFVEGALFGGLLIILAIVVLSRVEHWILAHARNINFYVEFSHVDDLGSIITAVKAENIRIFDVELHKKKPTVASTSDTPGALFSVRLPKHMPHTKLMALLAGIDNVRSIEEL
ncbi:MAG: MgtC/SapB family protein [Clostridia bacterium]|nr:MgtC/SapB family protein [Clostridia bacterium]